MIVLKKDRFTLIELLVVIAVISIMAAILLPAIKHAFVLTQKTHCTSNLRQVGIAMHMRANDYRGQFYFSWHKHDGRCTSLDSGMIPIWCISGTHRMVDAYFASRSNWTNSNWPTHYPASDKMKYAMDYRIFACPTAWEHSEWENLSVGSGPLWRYHFFKLGKGFYWTAMAKDKASPRYERRWLKGCHRQMPSPNHPSHTWTYLCPGHHPIYGKPANDITWYNKGESVRSYDIFWTGGSKYEGIYSGNVLYVDGHVRLTPQMYWRPGHSNWGRKYVDDGCYELRGDNCKF